MDEQRRRDLVLDDEVFLAGQGIFVYGVDPPLEPGGPIEVLAATDDPTRALSVLRERHGPESPSRSTSRRRTTSPSIGSTL